MNMTTALEKYGQINVPLIGVMDSFRNLCGIFDAAKDQRVAVLAAEHPESAVCLYNGDAAENMKFAAPYVFDFRNNPTLRDILLSIAWGDHWGIWLETMLSLEDLKSRFRSHHLVQLPDKRQVYFRFFDPRVFPTFIEHIDAVDRAQFIRGISCFVHESGEPDIVKVINFGNGLVQKSQLRVE